MYPNGIVGAPPGYASLFLDSSAEDRRFPLDKVEFTLVLRGKDTPDLKKSAQLLASDSLHARLVLICRAHGSLQPPLHVHKP